MGMPKNRLARRVSRWLPIHMRLSGEAGTYVGDIYDLSQTGARLFTDKPMVVGDRISIWSAPGSTMRLRTIPVRVIRKSDSRDKSGRWEYGLSFSELNQYEDAALKHLVNSAAKYEK